MGLSRDPVGAPEMPPPTPLVRQEAGTAAANAVMMNLGIYTILSKCAEITTWQLSSPGHTAY